MGNWSKNMQKMHGIECTVARLAINHKSWSKKVLNVSDFSPYYLAIILRKYVSRGIFCRLDLDSAKS